MTDRRTLFRTAAGVLATLAVSAMNAGCPAPGGGNAPTGAGTNGASPAAPVAVRLAYFPNVTHAPALVGVADGTFAKAVEGAATVEPKVFLNGPAAMEAVLAGEVDLAYVGVSPAINAHIKSRGEVVIVSGAASGGAVLVARADSGIAKLDDIVGKRIGTPQKGGTQDVAARYFVTQERGQKLSEQGGATQIIPADSPQLATLFQQKQLDAAWMQEPWGARLIAEQGAKLILDERDAWPGKRYATTVIVARKKFLAEHPDLVKRIVAAHVELSERIEKDRAAAVESVGAEIKRLTKRELPAPVIAESLGRIEFTADPFPATLQTQADRAFALGFLGRTKPDLSALVDTSALPATAKAGGA